MCDEALIFLVWYHIFSLIFQFEVYTFSHKNYTFRTTNTVRNVIRLAQKNEYQNGIEIIYSCVDLFIFLELAL